MRADGYILRMGYYNPEGFIGDAFDYLIVRDIEDVLNAMDVKGAMWVGTSFREGWSYSLWEMESRPFVIQYKEFIYGKPLLELL